MPVPSAAIGDSRLESVLGVRRHASELDCKHRISSSRTATKHFGPQAESSAVMIEPKEKLHWISLGEVRIADEQRADAETVRLSGRIGNKTIVRAKSFEMTSRRRKVRCKWFSGKASARKPEPHRRQFPFRPQSTSRTVRVSKPGVSGF